MICNGPDVVLGSEVNERCGQKDRMAVNTVRRRVRVHAATTRDPYHLEVVVALCRQELHLVASQRSCLVAVDDSTSAKTQSLRQVVAVACLIQDDVVSPFFLWATSGKIGRCRRCFRRQAAVA